MRSDKIKMVDVNGNLKDVCDVGTSRGSYTLYSVCLWIC